MAHKSGSADTLAMCDEVDSGLPRSFIRASGHNIAEQRGFRRQALGGARWSSRCGQHAMRRRQAQQRETCYAHHRRSTSSAGSIHKHSLLRWRFSTFIAAPPSRIRRIQALLAIAIRAMFSTMKAASAGCVMPHCFFSHSAFEVCFGAGRSSLMQTRCEASRSNAAQGRMVTVTRICGRGTRRHG